MPYPTAHGLFDIFYILFLSNWNFFSGKIYSENLAIHNFYIIFEITEFVIFSHLIGIVGWSRAVFPNYRNIQSVFVQTFSPCFVFVNTDFVVSLIFVASLIFVNTGPSGGGSLAFLGARGNTSSAQSWTFANRSIRASPSLWKTGIWKIIWLINKRYIIFHSQHLRKWHQGQPQVFSFNFKFFVS